MINRTNNKVLTVFDTNLFGYRPVLPLYNGKVVKQPFFASCSPFHRHHYNLLSDLGWTSIQSIRPDAMTTPASYTSFRHFYNSMKL